jgi:hypothetical protein
MTNRERPKDGQIRIKVSLESGANADSSNDEYVEPSDLGFNCREDWDNATEEIKLKAVQNYFYSYGYPEWSWDDGA